MRWTPAILACLAACGPGDKQEDTSKDDPIIKGDGPSITQGPTITSAGEHVPLSFKLALTTDSEATVIAELEEPDGTVTTVTYQATGTDFSLPLLGLIGDATTKVTVRVSDKGGVTSAAAIPVATKLPSVFPDIEVIVSEPEKMEPGYRLFSVRPTLLLNENEYMMIADNRGKIVWMLDPDEVVLDVKPFTNGNLLAVQDANDMIGGPLVEYTLLGEELQRWKSASHSRPGIVVDGVDGFHHDVVLLDDGNFLAISKEPLNIPTYHLSYIDRQDVGPQIVSSDIFVKFTPQGEVLETYHLSDILDTQRIGYDCLEPTHSDGLADWTHTNALQVDPSDGNIVISVRNQDVLVKFDATTHELIWMMGTEENWNADWRDDLLQPQGDVEWSYHQHGHDLGSGNRVLVFDNGLQRASPFVQPPPMAIEDRYSRVVEYTVLPGSMEVIQNWEFNDAGDGVLFSDLVGNARYMPDTGNVLGCFGYTTSVDGVPLNDVGFGRKAIRIVEFKPGQPHDVVFDMKLYSEIAENEDGWVAYRAEKLDSLYPPGVATVSR